jgi:1-deoxy-D-xylulose-5-phosphate synthase
MAPIDEASMKASMEFMRNYDVGLSAIRYPRDDVSDRFSDQPCPPFELGRARGLRVHDTPDVAILGFGILTLTAMDAAEATADEFTVDVYDARFAKPVDRELIKGLLERKIPIITIEDHGIHGGFGAAAVEAAADMGLDAGLIHRMALPDAWIYQGSRPGQLEEAGLDCNSVIETIKSCMKSQTTSPRTGEVVTSPR